MIMIMIMNIVCGTAACTQMVELSEQLAQTEEAYEREVQEKQGLDARMKELEGMNAEKQTQLVSKSATLETAEQEPGRLERQIQSMEHAVENMEQEYRMLQRRIRSYEQEVENQARRRVEAEKLRKTILEKLELNRQTLEEREHDVAVVRANLEKARAHHHDLVTRKVRPPDLTSPHLTSPPLTCVFCCFRWS